MNARALLFVSSVAASAVFSPQLFAIELLGVAIGQELSSLQECRAEQSAARLLRYVRFDEETGRPVPGPCYEVGFGQVGRPVSDGDVLTFRPQSSPSFLQGSSAVGIRVRAGRIDRITIRTTGYATQDRVAEALEEKLGPASSKNVVQKSNAMGATFDSLSMEWELPAGWVTFSGVTSTVNDGFLIAMSQEARAEALREVEQRRQADKF